MNFQEMVDRVIAITKRPDKTVAIGHAVNQAINFFCIETNFARDREEQELVLDNTLYAQSIAISDLTRFRKVEAIILPYRVRPLDHAAPDKLFAKGCFSNGVCSIKDAYYIAGDNIHISQSQTAASARISYFKYPPILVDEETFWLAEVSPYMIVDKAAAEIFLNIGDDTSYKYHDRAATIAYASARRDYAHGANYG